jgi:hypothetical protein
MYDVRKADISTGMSGNLKGKNEYEQKAADRRRVLEIQTESLTNSRVMTSWLVGC